MFLAKDGTIKIGDLNVSKVNKTGMMTTVTGTPYYASPEVWKGKSYDKKSDIWSLGIILYELAALKFPFEGKDISSLYESIKKGKYDRIPSEYSDDLQKVIDMCLKKKPSNRPSASQLIKKREMLAHYSEVFEDTFDMPLQLLDTIRPSGNLDTIQGRLPEPKYTSFYNQDKKGNSMLSCEPVPRGRGGSLHLKNKKDDMKKPTEKSTSKGAKVQQTYDKKNNRNWKLDTRNEGNSKLCTIF